MAAASAIGSAPPTRVVFFVANTGNPRAGAALASSPLSPRTGAFTVRGSERPQAARPPQTAALAARMARGRAKTGCTWPQTLVGIRTPQSAVRVAILPRRCRIPDTSQGPGDPIVGANLAYLSEKRCSFSASPSANPGGPRERSGPCGDAPFAQP